MRSSRRATVKTIKKTVRVNLLQGLVVAPTAVGGYVSKPPKIARHTTGKSLTCAVIRLSLHRAEYARRSDRRPGGRADSLHPFAGKLELIVRQMLDNQRERADPEAERKEIRGMMRLMRDNFERGLYEGEEYQYWQKVSG
jgi:hypothetical protein